MQYDILIVKRRRIISPDECYFAVPPSGGGSAVTWDPANTDSVITLSSGNLIGACTLPDISNRLSRATSSVSASSKKYWEVSNDTATEFTNAIGLGFVDSSFTIPQNNFLGVDSHSLGYYGVGGSVYTGGSEVVVWATITPGPKVISFALDTVNNKLWARVTGGNWNNDVIGNQNPATNTGGLVITQTAPLYPAFVFRSASTQAFQVTGKFTSASWAYSAPSGFTQL
jgi:hypothetical protein